MNADFETEFSPSLYLQEYYSAIDVAQAQQESAGQKELATPAAENALIMSFFARTIVPLVCRDNFQHPWLLEVGGGPTIYQLISLAPLVEGICFTDYLPLNLVMIHRWREEPREQWRQFLQAALILEGTESTEKAVRHRLRLLCHKLTSWAVYDVIRDKVSGSNFKWRKFEIVSSNFCLESITDSKDVWKQSFRHLSDKLELNGRLIMTALRGATRYRVGNIWFPAVPIFESDIKEMLKELGYEKILIHSHECGQRNGHYAGIMLATAVKGQT